MIIYQHHSFPFNVILVCSMGLKYHWVHPTNISINKFVFLQIHQILTPFANQPNSGHQSIPFQINHHITRKPHWPVSLLVLISNHNHQLPYKVILFFTRGLKASLGYPLPKFLQRTFSSFRLIKYSVCLKTSPILVITSSHLIFIIYCNKPSLAGQYLGIDN